MSETVVEVTVFGIHQKTLTLIEAFDMAEEHYEPGKTLEEYVTMFNEDFKSKGARARIIYG